MSITSELFWGVGRQKEKAENIYCSVVEQLPCIYARPEVQFSGQKQKT